MEKNERIRTDACLAKQAAIDWLRDGALHDAHCHLDFFANGEEIAATAAAHGLRILACTVEPADYAPAVARFGGFANVLVGLGMHPWWVGTDTTLDAFEQHVASTPLIGEVGLDFGKRGAGTEDAQRRVFSRIAELCAAQGGKTLSIHAVQSADAALDLLERAGTLHTCTCIFHWFSGNSNELARARKAGCYFSVNAMMLETRRGREYARQIPASRLLIETDWPPERDIAADYGEYAAAIRQSAESVAHLRA